MQWAYTFTYDDVGNRLTLITDPSSNLTTNTYDNNGNLTVTNDNGTVTTNTWTYDNRLRTVTLASTVTSVAQADSTMSAPLSPVFPSPESFSSSVSVNSHCLTLQSYLQL